MKKIILTSIIFFFAMIATSSLMADTSIKDSIKDLKADYSSNQMVNNFSQNEELLARRSGGRSGSRGFSSRSRSRSTSSGRTRSRSGSGYSSGRRSGGTFVYVGGGSRGYGERSSGTSIFGIIVVLLIIGLIIFFIVKRRREEDAYDHGYAPMPTENFNTIKLQFALYATAEEFKNEIMDLASELDYDSEEDLKTLINETSTLLIQNQDYVKYAFLKESKSTKNIDNAERDFDTFINEETAKFSKITFQNRSGNVRSRDLGEDDKPDFMEVDEYFIISIVVSHANTKFNLNKDNYSWPDYEKSLKQLGAVASKNIVAAEIIWSPDAKDDILTEDDIITHYPYMIQL